MTIRRISRGEGVAFVLLLCFGVRSKAEETGRDPNFQTAQGDVMLAPNGFNATRLAWYYSNATDTQPSIRIAFGTAFHPMSYYGYNDEGSWLNGNDARGLSAVFTIKGNAVTRQPANMQLPKNLKNGSPDYLAYIGNSVQDGGGKAQAEAGNAAPVKDPNFPKAQGAVTLAPNGFNAGYLTYEYHFGPDNPPNIDVAFKGNPQAVTYYGFDGGDTTWLGGPGGLYTVKGNVLSQLPKTTRLPRDLRNGSPAYYAAMGGTSPNETAPARQEQSPGKDPNFPKAQGDVALASNPYNATHMTYEYTYGASSPPYVNVAFRSSYQTMTYYGFDSGNTTWLGGNGGFYTIKGNVITQLPRTAKLPRDLRNGSPAYYAEIGVSKSDDNSGAASIAAAGGSPASGGSPLAGATVGVPRPVVAAPGSTAGTDVKIERGASGTTLRYKDASGEHSYKVRRPATASAGVDSVDAGGWVYVAPDGKSGLLLNVSPNHSVVVMPLAQPMLGMLAGRGN